MFSRSRVASCSCFCIVGSSANLHFSLENTLFLRFFHFTTDRVENDVALLFHLSRDRQINHKSRKIRSRTFQKAAPKTHSLFNRFSDPKCSQNASKMDLKIDCVLELGGAGGLGGILGAPLDNLLDFRTQNVSKLDLKLALGERFGCPNRASEASWEHLGGLGSIVGAFLDNLAAFWTPRRHLGNILAQPWLHFRPQEHLWIVLGTPFRLWEHLGSVFG